MCVCLIVCDLDSSALEELLDQSFACCTTEIEKRHFMYSLIYCHYFPIGRFVGVEQQ